MKKKAIKRLKKNITQISRWALFIVATITMSISIAEASAAETLELMKKNPEIGQYSTLVNSGYLFFK